MAALDDVTRFPDALQVLGYLGIVPSEYSSGDRRIRGRITKRGEVRAACDARPRSRPFLASFRHFDSVKGWIASAAATVCT